MTGRTFLNALANGEVDVVAVLLQLLQRTGADYCLIGGLAVNAYAEPVVSLDLDLVVVAGQVEPLGQAAREYGFEVKQFEHSLNFSLQGSDLRIQVQRDPRYQEFLSRAEAKTVLGYAMRVACLDDVLRGKIWAYLDPARRKSKRQKDLADIARVIEAYPRLDETLPRQVKERLG